MTRRRRPRLGLVLEAFLLCWRYRLLLWWSPMPTIRGARPPVAPVRGPDSIEEISGAVRAGARLVVVGNCLPQALAAENMLLRRGVACQLRIGVTRAQGFSAHAWVEAGGKIVHGETGVAYTALEPWTGRGRV